jgi:hypothetical protein
MVHIKTRDISRATLPQSCGNEGWIGLSPDGETYHLVVPVDTQIARGVMACNQPTDGTPFGGYHGWLYFRCSPYEDTGETGTLRSEQVRRNSEQLTKFCSSYGIPLHLDGYIEEIYANSGSGVNSVIDSPSGGFSEPCDGQPSETGRPVTAGRCFGCGRQWTTLAAFMTDREVKFSRYRACPDDFRMGVFLFSHACRATVELPVTKFARPKASWRSLIGTHACPGYCFYEQSESICDAECEGACYRRIALKLRARWALKFT